MKNKYRGGRPKGVKNGESSNPSKGKLWTTEEEKQECWKRAEAKLEELGWNDNYGHEEPSRIKQRLDTNNNRHSFTHYKGQHDELWGQDLSGDELLDLVYGDK